jgi:flagellar assembly factor FliW
MMASSTRFGQLEVDPATVLKFPRGIPGFETSTDWKLLYEQDESGKPKAGIVFHMQSLNDPDATLPVADPLVFGFNYEFILSDSELAELKLEDPADLAVLVVLSSKNPLPQNQPISLQHMYANIAAPILVNIKSRLGMQKIFAGPEAKVGYQTPR